MMKKTKHLRLKPVSGRRWLIGLCPCGKTASLTFRTATTSGGPVNDTTNRAATPASLTSQIHPSSAVRLGLINEFDSWCVAIAVSVCVFTPHQISTPPQALVSHRGLPVETTIPHQYLKRFLIKPRLHPGSSRAGETEGVSGDPLYLHLPIDFPSARKQWRQQIAVAGRGGGV